MPALTRRVALTALLTSIGLIPLVACQYKEPAPQPPPYYPPQPPYYPPPQPQPAPWAPPQTTNTMPPSFGFFCATDNDLQCTYGLCRGGRCGGCTDSTQCKRGSACQPTPVGMACFPAPQAPPQPNAPPVVPPSTPPGTPTAPPLPVGSDPYARARDMCVARINQYRQQRGVAPLARETQGEPCADEESGLDGRSNTAHGSFGHCGERAQDACPNYPGPVEQGLMQCLDQMLAEGPGGGHYDNMMNAKYTRAFCGFAALSGGRYWMIQDFR